MAVIRSGASTDVLTIGAVNKAARVELFDARGNSRGVKRSYRGTSGVPFAAAASASPFFIIEGSASTTVRVQRIRVSGLTLTAVAYLSVVLNKYGTAISAGTPATITQVPLDSTDAAGTLSRLSSYTAAPTAGSLVGAIASMRSLGQATTAVAGASPSVEVTFDFRNVGESDTPTLRGVSQGLGLAFSGAPATAVTLTVEVEWTEE